MKAWLTLAAVVMYGVSAAAQTAGTGVVPAPPDLRPTYEQLLQFQAKQFEEALNAQRQVSTEAIETLVRGQNLLQALIGLGGVLFAALASVGGWYFKRELRKFEDVLAKCDQLSARVDQKMGEFVNKGARFESDVARLESSIEPLEGQVKGCVVALDSVRLAISSIEQAGPINDRVAAVMLRARLAELRITLMSGTEQERVRAAQEVSEIARAERGAVALPVLLDVLRRLDTPAAAAAEALYGLGSRAKELAGDAQAEELIILASKAPQDSVRLQAVETMGKYEPMPVSFQTRLRECQNADVNGEVKAAASRLLNGRA